MSGKSISLDEAVNLTRTGDVWLFRGRSVPDRAIQTMTNSPVNHVGMSVVIDDMPPLMWHAELGRSLPDLWSGTHQRGVQLHDLREAVCVWATRYGQRAWLRQLDPQVTREMEDAVLRTVARLDGTPFPSTARLAGRWIRGRVPRVLRRGRKKGAVEDTVVSTAENTAENTVENTAESALESAYCAEVVAVTYEAMGLLPGGRRPNWYDPGRFWSGDDLKLSDGFRLGGEITVNTRAVRPA
ncbi:hypothetical protein [Streptosporangium carneum]|uniref:Guanylate cyclase n=1 Tax=Streptosporangium carneum TaxID=47481 RepID=A0A9W6MHA6_9ACTN|nr:hypothetical protein [Streptosporangium carneum]GLK13828.1 hypothetical protein GCM10017600_72390 [Streptosporangium carneum]